MVWNPAKIEHGVSGSLQNVLSIRNLSRILLSTDISSTNIGPFPFISSSFESKDILSNYFNTKLVLYQNM
jgi:hypothetical protein